MPNSVDIAVGRNIRIQRIRSRLSQEFLAGKIGVTFQQLQKYEKGINRVGASRLSMIANVLQVPIAAFFEGATEKFPAVENSVSHLINEPQVVRLVEAFADIPDARVKRAMVQLVEMISASSRSSKAP